jgi:hypothetical protein
MTNNGTAGDVANTGTFTNGVLGTIANLINSLFFTNDGTIAGTVTNNQGGTFNNTGTVQGATTNAGDLTNTGTLASLDNSGTANNSGTISGATVNSGTFTNSGSTDNVTNSGTFNSTGTSGSLTNTGIATISSTGSILNATNSGTLTISDSATAGDINNQATGLLDFNGAGNIGAVTNAGTFNASGLGTFTGLINSGTANISGAVTTGNINNSGDVNLTSNTAVFGTLTNSGLFNISGAGGDITAPAFTQTDTGTLKMAGLQVFSLSGPANIAGTFSVVNPPTEFGRYTMLTASAITGTFGTLDLNPSIDPLGAYLKYSGTEMKLFVTPSSVATQASIESVRNSSVAMNRLVSGTIAGGLGLGCAGGGDNGGCISFGLGRTKTGTGNLTAGSVTISSTLGKVLSDNFRVGVFLDRAFSNPTVGSVSYKPNMPVAGGFVGWNAEDTGTGFGVVASIAKQNGLYNISRPLETYAEAGTGIAKTNGIAYQVRASYSTPAIDDFIVTPYAGIRYTRLGVGGYTETGNIFPLSIDSYKQTTTDLLGGVTVSYKVWDDLTASVSAGVVKNVANEAGSINGTSEIKNMFTFANPLPGQKYLSGAFGAGLTYEFIPGQRVGVNVGWQHKTLTDTSIGAVGLTYSLGF